MSPKHPEDLYVVCRRCASAIHFERPAMGSTRQCDKCGESMRLELFVAPEIACSKATSAVDWFEAIGASLDGEKPRNVREVVFLDGRVVNEHVVASLRYFPSLMSIVIYRSVFDDALMRTLALAAPGLVGITILGGTVSDKGLEHFANHDLNRLKMPFNKLEGESLKRLKRLTELVLTGNPIKNDSLKCLLELPRTPVQISLGSPAIKRLVLDDTEIDDHSVPILLRLGVRELRVNNTDITNEGLLKIGTNPRWDVRNVKGKSITRMGRLHAWVLSERYKKLWRDAIQAGISLGVAADDRGLCLNVAGNVTAKEVLQAPWRGYKEEFVAARIDSSAMSSSSIEPLLSDLPNLSELKLRGQFTDSVIEKLSRHQISRLEITSDLLTDQSLSHINRIRTLQFVRLCCPSISDEAAEGFRQSTEIKDIRISRREGWSVPNRGR